MANIKLLYTPLAIHSLNQIESLLITHLLNNQIEMIGVNYCCSNLYFHMMRHDIKILNELSHYIICMYIYIYILYMFPYIP